jgi:predicted pyridoxine 5'-phosphate oxidase superfamily flavin-nucleotide-binding protein
MDLPREVAEMLLRADGKALATFFENEVNVVPVSSVRVEDGKIWLINYFLNKTLRNITRNPRGALAFWKGFEGYQVKGTLSYYTEGEAFDTAKRWIAGILPDRIVKGLIILDPEAVFHIAPSKAGATV